MSEDPCPTHPDEDGGADSASSSTSGCTCELIEVHWSTDEAMCGDQVRLIATAEHMPANTAAQGEGLNSTQVVMSESSTGQDTFYFPENGTWQVKDVVFSGENPPAAIYLAANASAMGKFVVTEEGASLMIKRIPDTEYEEVDKSISSGIYGWDAIFRVRFQNNKIKTALQMQYKKAWKGQWVDFDSDDDGRSGWAFIKKVGATWKFWDDDASPEAWANLPRNIGNYTVNDMIFIKDGSDFEERDAVFSETWPENFPENPASPNFDTVKNTWLTDIHRTWDGKFKLERKHCPSANPSCCTWPIEIRASWSTSSGDKLVYLIWTQFWHGTDDGRSDAQDWYIGDNRVELGPHEFGHLLGAYDEYAGGAVDPDTNITNNTTVMSCDSLTPKTRNLDNWLEEVTDLIQDWADQDDWEFEVKDV